MALPTGLRPRSAEERLRLLRALTAAPRVVALDFDDDGWAAAHLRIAGRVPVWAAPGDPARAAAALERLGLPGLGRGAPGGSLGADLRLRRSAPIAAAPLPPVAGPLVTILICTYNRAALLGAAIASAQAQSWPCEILVVDDGSTDGTAELLAQIEGIRVLRQPNGGKPRALNRGLAEARGEAVLVLDDDDLLLPGAVQVLARALFAHPELVSVSGDTAYLDPAGAVARHYPAARALGPTSLRTCLMRVPATTGATLIRMSAQRSAGAYDPRLTRGEDTDMFLRLAKLGPMESLPLTTFLVRRHGGARCPAGQRITTRDKRSYERAFLEIARPVFRERWAALAPEADRAEGHAWVVGLAQRGLLDEARREAARWPGPHSPAEAFAREQAGLASAPARASERLAVIDDGDPGALAATLERWAALYELHVDLEVPRNPLGAIQLHWPGRYAARRRLHRWPPPGPVHLRLSSDPSWAPPRLEDPRLLPDAPAPLAVRLLAAALGWPAPARRRPGLICAHPALDQLREARAALAAGRPRGGLEAALPVLRALPAWAPIWGLVAELFAACGDGPRAATYRAKAERLAG